MMLKFGCVSIYLLSCFSGQEGWVRCGEGRKGLDGVNFRFSGAVLSDQLAVLLLVDSLPGGTLLRVIGQGHPAHPIVFLWFIYAA